jgi:serine/threonine-protein kinase
MNDRDERLAHLLNVLEEDQRAGRSPEIDRFAQQNPDLADELRQLWGMAQVARLATQPTSPLRSTPISNDPPSSGTFPRTLGDYVLLREEGRGGMGIVYKARQSSLNRTVALKMLLHGDVATSDERARIRAEARAAGLLRHPNIIPVYEVGEHGGRDYFTMPFIEGRSLANLLAEGPLPPREAAMLISTLAKAVEHAHQQGIIHRDLKPGNILLSTDSEHLPKSNSERLAESESNGRASTLSGLHSPMIADFGLAKHLIPDRDSLTQTGAIVGTPSFMPPEQAGGNRGSIGPASDVYSLGAILYNCITGRPPFQAASRIDTIFMVIEQDPVPPRLLNPRVDRDLELICLKCLQKSPEMRYPSAAALSHDLDAYLSGEPLSLRPSELRDLLGWLFRPTHHITILENWGGLWMAHSLFTLLLCLLTWGMQQVGLMHRAPYVTLWGGGVLVWAAIFWWIRRRIGPVTFVERQIAHVWASGVAGSFAVMALEWLLGQPVLEYAPMLAVVAAMVFVCKAGILSGMFYLAAGALFMTAVLMACFPEWGMIAYGVTLASCYFVPGWIFQRRKKNNLTTVKLSDLKTVLPKP